MIGVNLEIAATRTLSVAHHGNRDFIPIEIRPHVSTALAAGLAGEAWCCLRLLEPKRQTQHGPEVSVIKWRSPLV